MLIARQSTARTVTVGPVLDSSGVAVTTAVVGDFKIAKNGGAPAALNGSATLTHRNTGHYSLALTASDTDTVGQAEVVIDATTNACPMKEITVVEEAVYDAMFAASAAGYQVPIWSSASATVSLSATTVATVTTATTTTNLTNLPTIPANWLTAAGTAADFGTEIGAAVLSALGTGTWASAIPWNASWDAEVQSEVDDALVAHRLDELLNADSDIDGAAPPTVGSVFHELMSKTASSFTYDQTTDSNEAIRDRGDAAWTTATGFSTLDAAGVRTAIGLASANLDTQLADLPTVAEFEARTIVAANYSTAAEMAKVPKSDSTVTWNATALASIQSECNDALVANNLDHLILSAVDTDFATTVHLNSVIGMLADNGTTASFDRTTDSLEAQRDNIGTAGAGLTAADDAVITAIAALNNLSSAQAQTAAAAALTAYDPPTNAEMEARTLAAASYATASGVSAILTTAMTESYATDGSAMTAAQALYMIWSAIAEVTVSSTTLTCKKLDGSTTAMTFTLDDATTPTSRTRAS